MHKWKVSDVDACKLRTSKMAEDLSVERTICNWHSETNGSERQKEVKQGIEALNRITRINYTNQLYLGGGR